VSAKAWVGVIAVSICNMIFYWGMFTPWLRFRSLILTSDFVTTLGWTSIVPLLEKSLDWAPIMILIASIIYALMSPAAEPTADTWRGL
jgi:hypothetical protein